MVPGQIGQIGWKSIEITLYACLVELGGRIGCKSIEITLYVCLVESVKLGANPLRLHCMPAWSNWSNWVQIHWDYIVCLPGRNRWSNWVQIHWDYIVILLGRISQIGCKSIEITLYACLVELGANPLRLHCMPAWSNQSNWVVELGANPLRLHCMPAWSNRSNWVVELGANLLRLHCMPVWSNRVEIHWDDAQFDQFDQALITGRIRRKSIEMISMDFHPI